ncbi:ParB/RepB/Spo0J family partition protein [Undibacterium sp. Ji22W]|uniref:ParB/RepB/Spo0J family partition protein n=1 Tax=Undibacterium sp. Ji22W TaxID=3413038 RepID=UPI003BF3E661
MEQFFQSLPIAQISISKTNRKRFNEQALNELADNIKANGLIQPILVRPMSPAEQLEPYEIVCGERRYRASIIAGLDHINTICRELTDTQAAELQLIENLQREDPHPMEEAEGYQALMLHSGYTADMLADKLNKSKSQIYATLKLCNLCTELRDKFFENEKFTRSLALLIARIPVPALQVEAFNEIIDEYGDGEPMSYRDAAIHVQMNYNVNLKIAIFSTTDAKLVPDAGSCKECPKRTDNDPDLSDLDKNVCTDPKCFEKKIIAHHAQVVAKANKKGLTVYEGATAAKAISAAKNNTDIFVVAETLLRRFDNLKSQNDAHKSFASAVGTDKLPDYVAVAFDGLTAVKLYDSNAAQSLLVDLGFCSTEAEVETKKFEGQVANISTEQTESDEELEDDNESEGGTNTEELDQSAEKSEKLRLLANEEIKRIRIYKAIRQRGQLSLESLRAFMKNVDVGLYFSIPESVHEEFYGRRIVAEEDRLEYIDQASSEQLQLLLIDYVIGDIQIPRPWSLQDIYLERKDDEFDLLQTVAQHEGIEIAIAEQEPTSPVQAPATEPIEPEAAATPAAKKRGRPSKADKAAQEAASKPVPMDKWPFPTTKTVSAS